MATVAQLASVAAMIMSVPVATVTSYTRVLQGAGLMPLSKGRRIEHVLPAHIMRLVEVLALEPKLADVVASITLYESLTIAGRHDWPDAPIEFRKAMRAGEMLELFFRKVRADPDRELRSATIEFVQTWPEVTLQIGNKGQVLRFIKPGEAPGLWQGYAKRSCIIAGQSLNMLKAELEIAEEAAAESVA
jgi:hypothetical protein